MLTVGAVTRPFVVYFDLRRYAKHTHYGAMRPPCPLSLCLFEHGLEVSIGVIQLLGMGVN